MPNSKFLNGAFEPDCQGSNPQHGHLITVTSGKLSPCVSSHEMGIMFCNLRVVVFDGYYL